jgi:pyruvate dehydrogenase E2 component (dihydrolipoamide acetyltransferase)
MSVSVSMPQLGESVTEGTVTRWLKKEGERVEVDEPLLEVSTDKVDTEIPSPASGILRGIAVDEDETVAVGAQLAVIEEADDAGADSGGPSGTGSGSADAGSADSGGASSGGASSGGASSGGADAAAEEAPASTAASTEQQAPAQPTQPYEQSAPAYQPPAYQPPAYQPPAPAQPWEQAPAYQSPAAAQPYQPPAPAYQPLTPAQPAQQPYQPAYQEPAAGNGAGQATAAPADEYPSPSPLPTGGDTPYVTPLVRKLAAEHAVELDQVTGTGVGGRIRKQDVIEAARAQRAAQEAQAAQAAQAAAAAQAAQAAQAAAAAQAPAPASQGYAPASQGYAPAGQAPASQAPAGQPAPAARAAAPAPRPAIVPSSLRGTTQKLSRPRQVIAQRMVESLQVSAQLTTVVEADVTAIARLRELAKRDFEAREGVKLSFLPFFALAAVEALKVHPKLNAVLDGDQVTYHDAEHLGIAVDTERGLMVPVIHNAGDLNIGGLARKIGDLAQRTRSGQVSPDELAGGTFTLTNTGSRGALFDTPIINQPQVAILGTGTVVKRAVVVEDAALGEVIAVRSMVYLALTYDHRLVDGADAARFLVTVKNRLEEGSFEAELGL